MYGKLIDSNLTLAPRRLPGDEVVVYNPPAKMYLEQGWKPVQFTDDPEAPSGYYSESGWEEQANAIVQTWTLQELPPEEATETDYAEALQRLGVTV